MANIVGKNGVVKAGTSGSEEVIGEVTYVASLKSFSGSVDVLHSVTAGDNHDEFAVGSSLTLELYPNGTASGEKYFEGAVLCTGKDVTSSFNDMVTATYSFQGTGALAENTVS